MSDYLIDSLNLLTKVSEIMDLLGEYREENIQTRKAILENNRKLEMLWNTVKHLSVAIQADMLIKTYNEREAKQRKKLNDKDN